MIDFAAVLFGELPAASLPALVSRLAFFPARFSLGVEYAHT